MSLIKGYVERINRLLNHCDIGTPAKKFAFFTMWFPTLVGFIAAVALVNEPTPIVFAAMVATAVVLEVMIFGYLLLLKNNRVEDAEEVLPDFLLLVANNIRSGMTPDRALLISAKDEFGVLGKEVRRALRETVSGKPFDELLPRISERLDSKPLANAIRLIIEGMYSGGDLPSLLERTSYDVRSMRTVRKDVDSVIVTYRMFIASAVVFGAPLLFAVATNIVEVMMMMREKISVAGLPAAAGSFTQMAGPMEVTGDTLILFAGVSILINTFFASLAMGLMTKGKMTDGLAYFPVLLLISLGFFFLIKIGLKTLLSGMMPV
ncbi:MAG: type II secretion system F family protein [Candidatus Micrarchaeota archaeon]|nr:type II secretion system F family protein [Candidatus Micrarchaeota archaeon]